MTTQELKQKKGLRAIYFKGLELKDFNIDLAKREVTMAWNSFAFKDDDKDIILKGAFAKSIRERGPESTTHRKIAYLKYHNWNLPIGPPSKIWEDEKYLLAKAPIDPTPEGDVTLTQYQTGTLNQHSIGYKYVWDKGEYSEADDAFIWKEIDLYEGSALVAGCNENTPLLEIHGISYQDRMSQAMDETEKLLKSIEIKTQYDLRKSISKLLALTELQEPGKNSLKKTNEPPAIKVIDYDKLISAMRSAATN